jgi:phytanoyl-CoA hydroxylase
MNTKLTAAQIESYNENGFVVIDDFLGADELRTWRETVADTVASAGTEDQAHSVYATKRNDPVFIQRFNMWFHHEGLRDLLLNPAIGKMAATLAGVEGMRLYTDQALSKPPWGNPTAWHIDDPHYSFYSRQGLNLWLALDDATVENGCMYFLPGTHKRASFNVELSAGATRDDIAELFTLRPEWKSIEAVAAPMKAGSCSCHNGLVAHAAGPNMTPYPRRAMTILFMPDGSTFNGRKGYFSESYVATKKIGDVLDDEEVTPLVYPLRS